MGVAIVTGTIVVSFIIIVKTFFCRLHRAADPQLSIFQMPQEVWLVGCAGTSVVKNHVQSAYLIL